MTSVSGRPRTKDNVRRFNREGVGCIETGKGVAGREGGKGEGGLWVWVSAREFIIVPLLGWAEVLQ